MNEDQQIEQIKISMYGQCPRHKGHAVANYFLTFLAGAYIGLMSVLAGYYFFSPDRESEAIKLGYAQHNAITGKWEWRK